MAGRSIGELQFRQKTGATIVAVRKGEELLLSPGPATPLQGGDVVVVACELTQLVHGTEEARKAQDAARALFSTGGDKSNMPATVLTETDLTDGAIGVLDLMLKCGLVPSKKEARRLIEQGGVELDGQKVADVSAAVTADQLAGESVTIKKGKKVFHRASL